MTVLESFKKAKEILEKAEVESSAFEVSVMMEDLLGLPKSCEILIPQKTLSQEENNILFNAAKKRADGYPLQYIVGNWEFWGRKFLVGEGVFIPRQDTELLCECAIKYFAKRKAPKLIDLCSGSGCIAVTLSKEIEGADVTAVELYDGAFDYLKKNIEINNANVNAVKGNALEAFGMFDGVISNPPYVTKTEMENLQKEVRYEPVSALSGGDDGLYFYRQIIHNWYSHINPKGFIAFEIGDGEGDAVSQMLRGEGFFGVQVWENYDGLERTVTAIKN